MKEEMLQAFKLVIRRRIDMRRMVAVCAGNREQARGLIIRGLREIADEIEAEGDKPQER